jgi:hypothetical protein
LGVQQASAQIKIKATPPTKATTKNKSGDPAKPQKIHLTGSRIPRTVEAQGTRVKTELTLAVIQEKQIRGSGRGSLNDALRRGGRTN